MRSLNEIINRKAQVLKYVLGRVLLVMTPSATDIDLPDLYENKTLGIFRRKPRYRSFRMSTTVERKSTGGILSLYHWWEGSVSQDKLSNVLLLVTKSRNIRLSDVNASSLLASFAFSLKFRMRRYPL